MLTPAVGRFVAAKTDRYCHCLWGRWVFVQKYNLGDNLKSDDEMCLGNDKLDITITSTTFIIMIIIDLRSDNKRSLGNDKLARFEVSSGNQVAAQL